MSSNEQAPEGQVKDDQSTNATMMNNDIIEDDRVVREKALELAGILFAIETGLDGLTDEDVVKIENCREALSNTEKRLSHDAWVYIMYTFNKAVDDLCKQGRARHSLAERVRRIKLCNDVASILQGINKK